MLKFDAHDALRPAGPSVVEVGHQGCTQSSQEEAQVVADLLASLLSQSLVEKDGGVRDVTLDDILVVAPFNAQVNALRRASGRRPCGDGGQVPGSRGRQLAVLQMKFIKGSGYRPGSLLRSPS